MSRYALNLRLSPQEQQAIRRRYTKNLQAQRTDSFARRHRCQGHLLEAKRILEEADRTAATPGVVGALLRREFQFVIDIGWRMLFSNIVPTDPREARTRFLRWDATEFGRDSLKW